MGMRDLRIVAVVLWGCHEEPWKRHEEVCNPKADKKAVDDVPEPVESGLHLPLAVIILKSLDIKLLNGNALLEVDEAVERAIVHGKLDKTSE